MSIEKVCKKLPKNLTRGKISMSNNQNITYEVQLAEDLRAYITNRSKEQELIEVLCKSPTLYERFFNKRAYELKQELVREDLQALRKNIAKAMEIQFALSKRAHEIAANVYLATLKAQGNTYLVAEYLRLKDDAIDRNFKSMERDAEKFTDMVRRIEEIYADRPDMLEKHRQSINRQMDSVFEANEQMLDNLLQLLKTEI